MSRHFRDLMKLLERCTNVDSYDVPGSEFTRCKVFERESGAGMLFRPGWHAADCPVPRLRRKYGRSAATSPEADGQMKKD